MANEEVRAEVTVIWFYARGDDKQMRLEARYDNDTLEFVIAIH